MGEWKVKPLSDLAILYNYSWKVGDEKCPYIALEHIEEGKLRLNGIGHSDIVTSNKYRFNKNNFLFGKLRPYFRKVVRPQFSGICSTDIWVVGDRGETDLIFLFYLFANQDFVDLAYSGSSGTKMPRADWKFMKDTVWLIPSDIEEQKAIASVLSSFDDKIDLLHRQNKTLEAMAEMLFRQWFVEEAQEDWEKATIGECCRIVTKGTTPTTLKKGFSSNGINFIKVNCIDENGNFLVDKFQFIDEETNDLLSRSKLEEGDILYSIAGTIGRLITVEKAILPANVNQALAIIRVDSEKINPVFMKYCLKDREITENLHSKIVHAVQPNLSLGEISQTTVPFPPKEVMKYFIRIVVPIESKLQSNKSQIQTLEKLRDALIPKLMSGEVRVEYRN